MPKRSEKFQNVLSELRRRLRLHPESYEQTEHAALRMLQRKVSRTDVLHVLRHSGIHEKKKDQYHEFPNEWAYAIRGSVPDGREIRVAVVMHVNDNGVLDVTVMDLEA
jgi:hypothetical protein